MLELIVWSLLALAAVMAATAVYVIVQALVGRAFGVKVERVALVGDYFGLTIARWQGRHWEWVIGALPLGGYTKFRGQDGDDCPTRTIDDGILQGVRILDVSPEAQAESDRPPPGSWQAAPLGARLLVPVSGPIALILLATLGLGVAVWSGAPQLGLCPPVQSQVTPCAVGGLNMTDVASTWSGQFALVRDIVSGAAWRLCLFQDLSGWGGLVGAYVTSGAAARTSLANGLTCVSVLLCAFTVVNLSPLGFCNGGHIIRACCEAVVGRKRWEKEWTTYALGSMTVYLLVLMRALIADGYWLTSL